MRDARGVRRRRLVAAMAAMAAVVGVGVVGVMARGGGERDARPRFREDLLAEAVPGADCPDAGEAPVPGPREVRLDVVRLEGHCLRISAEVVAADRSGERLAALRTEADVVAADRHVDYVVTAPRRVTRADGDQWALDPDQLDGDEAHQLWPADAPEVRVAVVDTGVDDRNLDLAGQVEAKGPPFGSAHPHGTHVAGIVAAADDGAGVVGLAPRSQLLDVQFGEHTSMAEHVRWSVDHGAGVVNISASSGDPDDVIEAALMYAERNGVVVVAGAGNCGDDNWAEQGYCSKRNDAVWPARYPTVLSVAAHSEDGKRWSMSSANESVDIAAPGDTILSDWRLGEDCEDGFDGSPSGDRPTCELSGTSMATPYVSATAALLLARQPDASPAAIREAITGSARTPVPDGQVADVPSDELGAGLLDPAAAADYLDRWPRGKSGRAAPSEDEVIAGGTIVAGYVVSDGSGADATSRVLMAHADGSSTLVQGASPPDLGTNQPAFSADGRWFAVVDGDAITFVDADSGEQRSAPCGCLGVAFTAEGQAATMAGSGNIVFYDPETAAPVREVRPVDRAVGPVVVGAAGDVILLGPGKGTGGAALMGVDASGRTGPIGPDPSFSALAVSDDGRRIAYAAGDPDDVCGSFVRVVDLAPAAGHGTTAALAGPEAPGTAVTDLWFDDDTLVATWLPPGDDPASSCDFGEPQQWSYRPVETDFSSPATVGEPHWEPGVTGHDHSRPTPTGAIYTELTGRPGAPDRHYQLRLGPGPPGQGSTLLAEDVDMVAVRPHIPLGP